MIPYGRQTIFEDDIEAVIAVLKSDFLTTGPAVSVFEKSIAQYCGAAHAVSLANGTAALHIACKALGVKTGDIVWTSPNSFAASANCALYCGAEVDFVDIDARTYNMSVAALEEKLIKAKKINRLPSVVIPVHFAGQPCAMKAIHALSAIYGFSIIEDACHAIGARYEGQPVGSCRYSDITVFSFHPVKIITTGEGGMIVTNRADLAEKARLLLTHGITRDSQKWQRQTEGAWYYEQIALGYNYRMTDIQAALGSSQLTRLDAFVTKRHAISQYYAHALSTLPIILPYQEETSYSSLHLYPILCHEATTGLSRKTIFDALRAAGINVQVHYIPIYWHPYYQGLGFKKGLCPNAEAYYEATISLPMFSGLTEQQYNYVTTHCHQIVNALKIQKTESAYENL